MSHPNPEFTNLVWVKANDCRRLHDTWFESLGLGEHNNEMAATQATLDETLKPSSPAPPMADDPSISYPLERDTYLELIEGKDAHVLGEPLEAFDEDEDVDEDEEDEDDNDCIDVEVDCEDCDDRCNDGCDCVIVVMVFSAIRHNESGNTQVDLISISLISSEIDP